MDLVSTLTQELSLQSKQITNVLTLTEEGATVPFLARYRKELTGNLDEVQIRNILERHRYLSELQDRKATVLKSIGEQGKLTEELQKKIEETLEKQILEDLYAPYRPKRRTRAQKARERGLLPLAEQIFKQQDLEKDIHQIASLFISEELGVESSVLALAGARDIIAEQISDDAEIRAAVRERTFQEGVTRGEVIPGQEESGAKFRDYFDFEEPVRSIPSHRMLALRRAEAEEVIAFRIEAPDESLVAMIKDRVLVEPSSPWTPEVTLAVEDTYKRLLGPAIEAEIRLQLKKRADEDAINVFGNNLRNLLLSPPLGGKRVLSIDPGFRTGCKITVLSETGRFVENQTIYPHSSEQKTSEAKKLLETLVKKHQIEAIAVGNGTAGRETEKFVRQIFEKNLLILSVDESGASVYSASDIAREEFPSLDLTVRGAISIGRRLQDPLAELVKIDPKSIGVGQYQHDVDQTRLKHQLHDTVESCVNLVGVDVNLASAPLLSYVSGIGPSLAKNIVSHRDKNGPFENRASLKKVSRFGAKTFEQAAGFLKISHPNAHPLDSSAVHPERYKLVKTMADDLNVPLPRLLHDQQTVDSIPWQNYIAEDVGMPTLQDIATELKRPGRDPREDFTAPSFDDAITEIEHLEEGMVLEGTITNVTHFGAFVNIGVHQDGLVHISHLSNQFVKDPTQVVSVGQQVKVKVLSVDIKRKRIGLSIRNASTSSTQKRPANSKTEKPERKKFKPSSGSAKSKSGFGTLADKLKNLKANLSK